MQHSENQPFTHRVLVIGSYELELASLLNYLYESGYDSIGARHKDEALRFFREHEPHTIIFTKTIDTESRAYLKDFFSTINETLTFFEPQGGVSALKLLLENS